MSPSQTKANNGDGAAQDGASPRNGRGGDQARCVAVTFDDVPAQPPLPDEAEMRHITTALLRIIKEHDIPAVGFVNEGLLYVDGQPERQRVELLRLWVEAGVELGNHTFSHCSPERVPLSTYADEIIRGELITRQLLGEKGQQVRYFRHPYLLTGSTPEYKSGLEQFLVGRGYTIAPVTIKHQEWMFAKIYDHAKRGGDSVTMREVVAAYIPYMTEVFAFFERLSLELFGYEIKHVLLLHASSLNADHFGELAHMIEGRGYNFVSVSEALTDAAYGVSAPCVGAEMPSWMHRWAITKGVAVEPEPREPAHIRALFERLPADASPPVPVTLTRNKEFC